MKHANAAISQVSISELDVADLASGGRHRFWLEVAGSFLGPVAVPALVVKGQPGPTLLAIAGVHGDEYEGMEAIRHTYDRLDPSALTGTFIGLPVVNPHAYAARMRASPERLDGLNLARVFPGDEAGSPTRALAARLLGFVERTVGPGDLFVDFHSGSADVEFASLIGFRDVANPARGVAEEAARHFGVTRLWCIPDGAGPFNAETARRGIPTLGTETTGRAGCEADDIATFARGLWNLLAYLGILTNEPAPPRLATAAAATIDVLAPATGFYRGRVALDARVTAGECLGVIVDVFGDEIATVRAPFDGSVWARRTMPPVHAGELLHMIALD